VCDHPELGAVDKALVASEASFRNIARRFSVSVAALHRHKTDHLPAALLRAREVEEVAHADDLLADVRSLKARTLAILEVAEATHDLRTALGAIREARSNLELLAKLLGELNERPQVNISLSPEWWKLRAVIVRALESHPDAREDVLRALEAAPNG
jgi:hypothetical protein